MLMQTLTHRSAAKIMLSSLSGSSTNISHDQHQTVTRTQELRSPSFEDFLRELGQNGNGREDEADEMEELKVCDYVSNRGVPDLSLVQSMPVHKIEAHHI